MSISAIPSLPSLPQPRSLLNAQEAKSPGSCTHYFFLSSILRFLSTRDCGLNDCKSGVVVKAGSLRLQERERVGVGI